MPDDHNRPNHQAKADDQTVPSGSPGERNNDSDAKGETTGPIEVNARGYSTEHEDKTSCENQGGKRSEYRRGHLSEGLMIAMTAVMALSSVVSCDIYRRQSDIMDAQLSLMREPNEQVIESIKATNRIADAMFAANRLAEERTRPWVSVTDFFTVPQKLEAGAGAVVAYARNSGQSPAHVTTFWIVARPFTEFPAQPSYHLGVWEPNIRSSSILLPGGEISNQGSFWLLSTETFDDIKKGRQFFYIYGRVEYEDLRNATPRLTRFCYVYVPSKEAYINCDRHNDAS